MHLKLLTMAVAIAGTVITPALAEEKPLWNSTIGDLIGIPAPPPAPGEPVAEPGSVNIEFVVDQCDVRAGRRIDLADLQPEPDVEPLAEVAALPKAEEPQPVAAPAAQFDAVAAPEAAMPDPMDLAVAPDAVLPSLESFVTPSPVAQLGPVQVSPSIVYLP
jgi:hypothetical protein